MIIAPSEERAFRRCLRALNDGHVPYIIAGAFASHFHTGLWRYTKDLDIFVMPGDAVRTLDLLADAGYRTEIIDEHWLGKAYLGSAMTDVIWGAGNWVAPIDTPWISRAHHGRLFGVPVRFAPPEEIIWMKAYVAGRERFDGADISHLILATGRDLDWHHLVDRFGTHWELLLHYLILFRFVFPGERDIVPGWVLQMLMERMRSQIAEGAVPTRITRGPLLDRFSYHWDITDRGFDDPRDFFATNQGRGVAGVDRERAWAAGELRKQLGQERESA